MPFLINYKGNPDVKEKYAQMGITKDMEIWLVMHGWKIRKLNTELNGKPVAELIRLDERLMVVINEEKMKMRVLNDVEFTDI